MARDVYCLCQPSLKLEEYYFPVKKKKVPVKDAKLLSKEQDFCCLQKQYITDSFD
jgi:hypothetical protein